jgi:hypothetical protein
LPRVTLTDNLQCPLAAREINNLSRRRHKVQFNHILSDKRLIVPPGFVHGLQLSAEPSKTIFLEIKYSTFFLF